jgi:hypothetical protein
LQTLGTCKTAQAALALMQLCAISGVQNKALASQSSWQVSPIHHALNLLPYITWMSLDEVMQRIPLIISSSGCKTIFILILQTLLNLLPKQFAARDAENRAQMRRISSPLLLPQSALHSRSEANKSTLYFNIVIINRQ